MSTMIHPTAIIGPEAQLGVDVAIGPHVIIEDRVEIGDGSRLDAFAQVKSFTTMGKSNHVHSYACIGGVPQDLKFHGEESYLRIGDNNTIREFVTLNRGTEGGGGVTSIGSGCLIMAYVHVAHDCKIGNGVIFSNGATLAGHVEIGDRAIIGGLTAVHQFVRIGQYAFVGGKTGLAQDLPPFMLAAGERARMHGPNLVGLRRAEFASETIQALKNAYKTLWRSSLSKQEALAKLEQELDSLPEIKILIEFIRTSERGITPAS